MEKLEYECDLIHIRTAYIAVQRRNEFDRHSAHGYMDFAFSQIANYASRSADRFRIVVLGRS